MKKIVFAAACCLAAAVSVSAHAASAGAPPCTPKVVKIQGHQAGVNCGPATATLHVGGRTYTFRNGFCQQSKVAGAALELNLGTVVNVKGNAGRPFFSMTIGKNHFVAGVGSADYGGKELLGGEGLIDVKGNIPASGTFTSRSAAGKFTGSWNCHGVVWQGP